ncbi:hypothetical protein L6452_21210 [Arctium lappa]|uniref:Uncharacterized protein n=1 Tax=Arctium lappa TaxID=4217 RepID=A0ACB9BHX1_ARCLA|nr:hypothetical protein L6452_21210 [Arctium lappa]
MRGGTYEVMSGCRIIYPKSTDSSKSLLSKSAPLRRSSPTSTIDLFSKSTPLEHPATIDLFQIDHRSASLKSIHLQLNGHSRGECTNWFDQDIFYAESV